MNSKEHLKLIKKYLAKTCLPLPIVLSRGEGVWVWDVEGKKYLDMLSCYSAVSAGQCYPGLISSLIQQIVRLGSTSQALPHDQLGPFLKELAEFTGYEKVLPMNTGVEAVERAIKTARKWGYKQKDIPKNQAEIIVCENNFHGRTITVISFSSESLYREDFGPYTPGFKIIPFGDAETLELSICKNTVAFLAEAIQAEAGIILPPRGYLNEVKKICQKHGILFILDEIQTGLGRTGRNFAWQHENAKPDLLILGKFLGGGEIPVSAVLGPKEVLDIYRPGENGSTFSGNPLACAVAREALNVLVKENLAGRAAILGRYFLEELKKINSPYIKEVRGRGLLIGVELWSKVGGARKFCERLMAKGILSKETHAHIIRFTPPLIISKEEIDWALERIERVLIN